MPVDWLVIHGWYISLTVLGARPYPWAGTAGTTGSCRIWQSFSPQVHLYLWRSTKRTPDPWLGKGYSSSFFLKKKKKSQPIQNFVLTMAVLLKVLRSASPLREGSSTSLRQERQTSEGALILCWMKLTECWTWASSRRFGKLWTKSEYVF